MMNLQIINKESIKEKKMISQFKYSKVNNNSYSNELQEIINSMSKENNQSINIQLRDEKTINSFGY